MGNLINFLFVFDFLFNARAFHLIKFDINLIHKYGNLIAPLPDHTRPHDLFLFVYLITINCVSFYFC